MRQRPPAQLRDAQQVDRLLDALAHDGRRDAELFHHVREFFFDGVGDERAQRVLADVADHVGEVARHVVTRRSSVDDYLAAQLAAREVRDEAVDRAQQASTCPRPCCR